ncbi:MoaD/ThiS family protein [Amycolatopsis nigrescens]|uniref:MoaD/ThiS family protein n=1 Tax=Amycolatopsis nigrescens TaxID=381445 RepID=UPI000477CFD1|nr:MoaD/ThiS family protein [Amycolatopsis nigrescens]
MRVVVLVPGTLRSIVDGNGRVAVEVGEPATLGAVLDELSARYPLLERRLRDERGGLRRYVNFYLDGEECRRLAGVDTPVPPGGEIQVLPSVAGG